MTHKVRTHTRRQGGRTVTVHTHTRDDTAAAATAQRKRDTFERRVVRERQEAAHPEAYASRRTPGQRKQRGRGPRTATAKRHAKTAARLWRRHKIRATAHAGAAAAVITAWAAWQTAAAGRRAWRRWRKRRTGRRR